MQLRDAPHLDLSVALIVGGHEYDAVATMETFASFPGVTCYPQTLSTFLRDMGENQAEYDCIVFYNFHGHGGHPGMTDDLYVETVEALQKVGERGQGVVALHHGIGAFPGLEEWQRVTGTDGSSLVDSHFNQTYKIHSVDNEHPITDGVSSFEITGETYEMNEPEPGSEILLKTHHDPSMDSIAWSRQYRHSQVFCFQCGHDKKVLSDTDFRNVLLQGLIWTAQSYNQ